MRGPERVKIGTRRRRRQRVGNHRWRRRRRRLVRERPGYRRLVPGQTPESFGRRWARRAALPGHGDAHPRRGPRQRDQRVGDALALHLIVVHLRRQRRLLIGVEVAQNVLNFCKALEIILGIIKNVAKDCTQEASVSLK